AVAGTADAVAGTAGPGRTGRRNPARSPRLRPAGAPETGRGPAGGCGGYGSWMAPVGAHNGRDGGCVMAAAPHRDGRRIRARPDGASSQAVLRADRIDDRLVVPLRLRLRFRIAPLQLLLAGLMRGRTLAGLLRHDRVHAAVPGL